ncbi:hypothetical protein BSKO_05953 [Bryopsis sp. KO-2023]|nr:hypothetical protein BSKO_05953 [Bryopsis sp. KO-2023]
MPFCGIFTSNARKTRIQNSEHATTFLLRRAIFATCVPCSHSTIPSVVREYNLERQIGDLTELPRPGPAILQLRSDKDVGCAGGRMPSMEIAIVTFQADICLEQIQQACSKGGGCTDVLFIWTAYEEQEKAALESDPEGTRTPFEIVRIGDESELPIGSEAVPLNTEVLVHQQQRGHFPQIDHLLPKEDYLHVTVSRDLDFIEEWVAAREADGSEKSLGYMVHVKKRKTKPTRIGLLCEMDDEEEESGNFVFNEEEEDEEEEEYLTEFEEDLFGEVDDDFEENMEDEEDDFRYFRKKNGTTDAKKNDIQKKSDQKDEDEEEEYSRLRGGGASGQFDYYEDNYFDEEIEDEEEELRQALAAYPHQNVPERKQKVDEPPRVWTEDEQLAEFWSKDTDGPDFDIPMPEVSIPMKLNRISLLTVSAGKHILIVQLRRMRAVGPRFYDLLYDHRVPMLSFNHQENTHILRAVGLVPGGGTDLSNLLLKAFNAENLNAIPYPFRKLASHGFARVLAGVDISDREFYVRDYNNPILSERHVSCLAKEVFSTWAIHKMLEQAQRTDFFGIGPFVQNPIPPSYMDIVKITPPTVVKHFTWVRGPFYKDLGQLLPKREFPVEVTVTRDAEVANAWCEKRKLERTPVIGYNMEWAPGKSGQVSAIFTASTENEILICQQLYMEVFPEFAVSMLHLKAVRKCGPLPLFYAEKRGQPALRVRGCDSMFNFLIPMFRKQKKPNLPKVVRDMTFDNFADMVLAVENGIRDEPKGVRWDRPSFTDEEIEYQALRAWKGWAIHTILSRGTTNNAERLKAYLLGPLYVPKKPRLPTRIRKRLDQALAEENGEIEVEEPPKIRKSPKTKGIMHQGDVDDAAPLVKKKEYVPEKLKELSEEMGDVTAEELNDLMDSFF